MIDLFAKNDKFDLDDITCHSGGAIGSDTIWEREGEKFGVKTLAYSYQTNSHITKNKVEISKEDFEEGIKEINKANKHIGRWGIHKYMNLLARNWTQVKYSSEIFAIGVITEPGAKTNKGYYSKSKIQTIDGGTGYAVMMGIVHQRPIFVFDQSKRFWFRWSYNSMSFIKLNDTPSINCNNFAGIGTREINEHGINAIKNVYTKTFNVDK